jgi:ferredoxin--NADP+ reductase
MWQLGTVVGRIHWSDHVFSLQIETAPLNFLAGQFLKLSEVHQEHQKRLARAYSLVNPPQQPVVEVLVTRVQGGAFSHALYEKQLGDKLEVSREAHGFLTLAELPVSKSLLMLATGTGVSPYLSLLQEGALFERYERIGLVYGVRQEVDLCYIDLLNNLAQKHQHFSWCASVTRDSDYQGITQRIPEALKAGIIEAELSWDLQDNTHVLLCGNPGLVHEGTQVLQEMGLSKHRRQQPGQISVGKYW